MKNTVKWLGIITLAVITICPVFAQNAADFIVDGNGVITKYNGFDTEIVIPATIGGKKITAIGSGVFGRSGLTSVTIPEGVTSIGDGAFSQNKHTSLTLPGTVKKIGEFAFSNNPITAIVLPEGVETVNDYAFSDTKCTSVSIPSTIKSLSWITSPSYILAANINIKVGPDEVFYNYIANGRKAGTYTAGMKSVRKNGEGYQYYETEYGAVLTENQERNVTRVRIPAEIGGIPVKALYKTFARKRSIEAVQIPEGIIYIGESTFLDCNLGSVTIPAGVTYIGESAFCVNRELASVTIPGSVTYIGSFAFSENQLTSVTISAGVTHIGEGAFQKNKLSSVTIPSSVIYIGSRAFIYNDDMTTITIPATVKTLDGFPIDTSVDNRQNGNSIVLGAGININYDSLAEAYRKSGAGRYTYNTRSNNPLWIYSAR
jgi:hypothetical protein